MATIRKLPSGKFRAEIRKSQIFIKAKTFTNKIQSEQWAKDYDSNIETILNLKPKKLKKLSPSKVKSMGGLELFQKLGIEIKFTTFKTLANEYMMQWTGKDKSQGSRVFYWQKIFNHKPIKSITIKHIRKAVDNFANEGMFSRDGRGTITNKKRSSNTVIRYKAVLSSMFKYAIQRGYIKDNPVTGVFVKATPNTIERYLSGDEKIELLEACKQSSWDKLHLLIIMAITTGMRKAELMNLRWTDIDFSKALAKLGMTKNGTPRINPIPAPAMQELKKIRQIGNGLIFHSPTKPEQPFEFRKRWLDAKKIAGIDNFRFHDLRHSAASYLVMGGATLHETAEILGHKSTETTKRYAHLSTAHKSEVAERIMSKVFNM